MTAKELKRITYLNTVDGELTFTLYQLLKAGQAGMHFKELELRHPLTVTELERLGYLVTKVEGSTNNTYLIDWGRVV